MEFSDAVKKAAIQYFTESLDIMGAYPAGSVHRQVHAFDFGTAPGSEPGSQQRFCCLIQILPEEITDMLLKEIGRRYEEAMLAADRPTGGIQ